MGANTCWYWKIMTLKIIRECTKKYSVLYVEDEQYIRESMEDVLEFFFKKVDMAIDGIDGLERFDSYPYDIIITDIQMPRMNGIDMIVELRKISPRTPIILTTAFNEREYHAEAKRLGVDEYLLKPLSKKNIEESFYKVAKSLEGETA